MSNQPLTVAENSLISSVIKENSDLTDTQLRCILKCLRLDPEREEERQSYHSNKEKIKKKNKKRNKKKQEVVEKANSIVSSASSFVSTLISINSKLKKNIKVLKRDKSIPKSEKQSSIKQMENLHSISEDLIKVLEKDIKNCEDELKKCRKDLDNCLINQPLSTKKAKKPMQKSRSAEELEESDEEENDCEPFDFENLFTKSIHKTLTRKDEALVQKFKDDADELLECFPNNPINTDSFNHLFWLNGLLRNGKTDKDCPKKIIKWYKDNEDELDRLLR